MFRDKNSASAQKRETVERNEARIHDEEYSPEAEQDKDSLSVSLRNFWSENSLTWTRGTYIRGRRKALLMTRILQEGVRGKTILEIGCGTGRISTLLALKGATVYGIDLSTVGISVAQDRASVNDVATQCLFSVQNAADIGLPSNCIDLVVANAVLHHAAKYTGVGDELARVLRPGGYCFFAEGIRANPLYRACRLPYRIITGTGPKGDVDISASDLRRLFAKFTSLELQYLTLSSGIKELIAQDYEDRRSVIAVLRATSTLDDFLLDIVPNLRHWCLEVVGCARR